MHHGVQREEEQDGSGAAHWRGVPKCPQQERELFLHCFTAVSCNEMMPVVVVTSRRS